MPTGRYPPGGGWTRLIPKKPIQTSTPEMRKTESSTKISIQTADPSIEKITAVKWLKPDESIARLEPIIEKIKKTRANLPGPTRGIVCPLTGLDLNSDAVKQTKLMFLDILLLLLTSHLATVKYLNLAQSEVVMQKLIGSENITCDIPWDEKMGLPSHPTLAADAKSYPRIFKPEDGRLSALCESFSGWSRYATQKELCACNSRLRINELIIEILVNHILKAENGWISIKQLIGLRSKDTKRLEKHYYEDKSPSRFVDSLLIISDVSWTFSLEKGFLAAIWSANPPEQFKIDKFQAQIASIVGAFFKKEFVGKGGP